MEDDLTFPEWGDDAPNTEALSNDPDIRGMAAWNPDAEEAPAPKRAAPTPRRAQTHFQAAGAPLPTPAPDMSWQEAGQQALKNLAPSALEAAQSIGTAVAHPIKTAENLGQLGAGFASQAAGALGFQQDPAQKARAEQLAKALEAHYANAYGSAQGFKAAVAKDPVGMLMDAATVADPALGAAGKLAEASKLGTIAKVAQGTRTAASFADPVANAVRVAKAVPAVIKSAPVRSLSAMATGVPKTAMDIAANVGKETDPLLRAKFQQYLSGAGDPTEFLQTMRNAINDVKAQNSADYMTDKAGLASTPVSFDNAQSAIDDAEARLKTGAPSGWEDQRAAVDTAKQWLGEVAANPDPAMRNIVHADALKQQLWNLIEKNPASKSFLTPIWSGIKSDMSAVDPRYVDLMERYQRGLDQVNTLQKTFGMSGSKSSGMASLLKGMKAIKTSAGKNLLDQLAVQEPSIPYMIAGQTLNPWHAQHLQGLVENAGFMAAIPWLAFMHHPGAIPAFAAQAAIQSPHLAGQVFSGASKLTAAPVAPLANVGRGTYYAGRADQEAQSPQPEPQPSNNTFTRMLHQESGNQQFGPDGEVKVSPKGAVGAAQVMPQTGPEAAALAGEPWDPNRLAMDPDYNRKLGQAYFEDLRRKFGDDALAAAAYNAGPGSVERALARAEETGEPWLRHLPAETQRYVSNLLAENDQRPQHAKGGKVESRQAKVERLVGRLMTLAEKVKKAENKRTEPLLNASDNLVAKALATAQRGI